ncbi:MAG TPA: hypothetical protein VKZ59_16110 [Acidobacteriota bacterium]|nr:hypothetical protein [Acidobacteriota bacterium]
MFISSDFQLKIGYKSRCEVRFKGDPIGNLIMGRKYEVIFPGGHRTKVSTLPEALHLLHAGGSEQLETSGRMMRKAG